jgi:hypothetical protein
MAVLGSPAATDLDRLAEKLLQIAAEVTDADTRIKQELLAAAQRRDCDRIEDILRRWLKEPAVELGASL